MTNYQISQDEVAQQFTATVDGAICELDYRLTSGVMTITHTGVPPQVGGRGIAAELTRTALETARARGWKVVPACSYAIAYMRKHPEFAELLAG